MKSPRVLVAGIGNIFLGDDAFGVEVAQRLLRKNWPAGVRVGDFGIRGMDLVYALLSDHDVAILVDAAPRGEAPGTLYVIQPPMPDPAGLDPNDLLLQVHSIDPVMVLRLAVAMGARTRLVLVVGCEPIPRDSEEDMLIGMSDPVRAAVEPAVELVESLVNKLLRGEYDPDAQVLQPSDRSEAAGKETQSWSP